MNFPVNENSSKTRRRFEDEESGGGVEKKLQRENDNLLSELSRSLKIIRQNSSTMKEKLISSNRQTEEIEGIFEKSFKSIKETMNNLTEILKTTSGIYLYLAVFVFLVLSFVFIRTVFI